MFPSTHGNLDLPEDARYGSTFPRAAGQSVVLAVEVDVAARLREAFDDAGFALSFARSSEEAHQHTQERIPAAVLVAPFPGSDPYATVRLLRRKERLAFVQIFMFVTDRKAFRIREALTAGVDDILEVHDASQAEAAETADRIVGRIARAQSLAQLALLDPLTQLYNRRFMNERLPAEVAHAARTGVRFSIAFLDLDGFKNLNDAFGHAAGDRALARFGHMLRSGLRLYDVACRFGGDEFVVLFPDCDAAAASAALTKLRMRRGGVVSDLLPSVTFSAGVAEFPDDGGSWTELFDAADANVRLAKKLGRGRTIAGLRRSG